MLVRLGFVAISVHIKDASPSKTITRTRFDAYGDPQRALGHVRTLVETNAENTLRILRYCSSRGIHLYRLTSKLIPLSTLLLQQYEPLDLVTPKTLNLFSQCGSHILENHMRISAHPDHFTVLGSTNPTVTQNAVLDLRYHDQIYEWMGLRDPRYKLVLHIGSAAGGKEAAMQRFADTFDALPPHLKNRLMLENDDKTYTAAETLALSQALGVPMILDYHHMMCNGGADDASCLPAIVNTWKGQPFPPKFHFSSPRSEKTPRAHADYIDLESFWRFLLLLHKNGVKTADVMLEAKQKDDALFQLMRALGEKKEVRILDGGSFELI